MKALENLFGTKMTAKGRDKMAKLIQEYSINNDTEKVAMAVNGWSADIPELFVNLPKEKKFQGASLLLKMLQHVATKKPTTSSSGDTFPVECNDYDLGILTYIGGWLLHKAKKEKSKNWDSLLDGSRKLADYDILEPRYNFWNFMNDKYDGQLEFIPSNQFSDYLVNIYLVILRYYSRNLCKCNLISLYNEVQNSAFFEEYVRARGK